MAITSEQVRACFEAHGCQLTRETAKVQEFRTKSSYFIYAHKEIGLPNYVRVVLDPRIQSGPYLDIPGISSKNPTDYFHSSNMLQFPKRRNTGEGEIHYGRPLDVASIDALGKFLERFHSPRGIALVGEEIAPASSKPRITAIELENFKGIGERVRLELKPITLLFGANSAGKSTILQALQYVREILERRNANPDRTIYGGEWVDLGGFRNIVHGRDLSKSVKLKCDISLADGDLPNYVPQTWDEWNVHDDSVWNFDNMLQETKDRVERASVEIEIRWSAFKNAPSITRYDVGFNGEWFCTLEAGAEGRDIEFKLNEWNPVFVKYYTPEEMADHRELFKDMTGNGASADLSYDSDDARYSLMDSITIELSEAGIEKPSVGLKEWFSDLDGALPRFDRLLEIPTGKALGAENVYKARDFTAFLTSMVVGPGELLRNYLRKLRYLGPIRVVPERGFEPLMSPDEARWANGLGAWDALVTSPSLAEKVSEWMSGENKLNTGYRVVKSPVKTIDAAYLRALISASEPDSETRIPRDVMRSIEATPEKYLPLLVDAESGMELRPKDVGIGISQVLPVVVAALDEAAEIITIEQPELHIHPAIQVGLGDLFISQVKENGRQFLIETHSEHLMLRLLRRIRETAERELPPDTPSLRPDQVAVIYAEQSPKGTKLSKLEIAESGDFTSSWPRGFFEERAGELF